MRLVRLYLSRGCQWARGRSVPRRRAVSRSRRDATPRAARGRDARAGRGRGRVELRVRRVGADGGRAARAGVRVGVGVGVRHGEVVVALVPAVGRLRAQARARGLREVLRGVVRERLRVGALRRAGRAIRAAVVAGCRLEQHLVEAHRAPTAAAAGVCGAGPRGGAPPAVALGVGGVARRLAGRVDVADLHGVATVVVAAARAKRGLLVSLACVVGMESG